MSRLALSIVAFACALLLTSGSGWQLMIYLHPAPWRVALWLPFAGLLHVREISYVVVWLTQFPLLAGVFVTACRWWSPPKAFAVLLAFYALCSLGAFFVVKAYS